jgi:N4-gp56 family major capsid protein
MSEINLYGDISRETAGHLSRQLLRRNKAMIHTEKFAQGHVLPKNSTRIMNFRRYQALALATTPLSEGVTPTGQKITYEDITVTLEQFGKRLVAELKFSLN